LRILTTVPWDLTCPSCHALLAALGAESLRCPECKAAFSREKGIWRLLAKNRQDFFREFLFQYETVRAAENRGAQSLHQLRQLPYRDVSGRRSYEWSIRARSYETLVRRVVRPIERSSSGAQRILDLGSGMGWLAYRLTQRGHDVAAIDLSTSDFDGLGAHRLYDRALLTVQAEFDRLPLGAESVDLAIYNASFHYASSFETTLREALRVLVPRGRVVVMDTPIYRDAESGAAMVREREDAFLARFGFRGSAFGSEGFLTYDRLSALGTELALRWTVFEPWYGLRWWLKPYVARLRRSREPARFKLIVGTRRGDAV
jgi:SAM-dependent methyltransferase